MIIMKKIYFTLIALLASINMFAQGWPANYSGVMLQGFSWDSYDYSQWTVLEKQADDMKGFIDLVWLPQSGKCIETTQVMGYKPYYYFKRCYGMSCITTKLEETQLTSIALSVFVTNLFRIQRRILCALLHLFRFWHDRNRCKSWKLQIVA